MTSKPLAAVSFAFAGVIGISWCAVPAFGQEYRRPCDSITPYENNVLNASPAGPRIRAEWAQACAAEKNREEEAVRARDAAEATRLAKSKDDDEKRRSARTAAMIATMPKCTLVEFTGVAVGATQDALQAANGAADINSFLDEYPLRCSPSMIQTYACTGAGSFVGQLGFIVDWDENSYEVVSPVEFSRGTHDTLIFINRDDAVCLNNRRSLPSFPDNLRAFFAASELHR